MASELQLTPNNSEAEKSILGALLVDDSAIIRVADALRSEDFYEPRHQLIYAGALNLYSNGKAVDVLTLATHLKQNKQIAKTGGAAYLTELVTNVTSAANIEDYAALVKDTSMRRRLINVATRSIELARQEDSSLEEVVNQIEQNMFAATSDTVKSDFVHIKDLLTESFEITDQLTSGPDQIRGIKTGFSSLDNLLSGLNKSDLIILAARPAVGKSSFALDVARHAAIHEKKSVGVFSLEMAGVQIMDRILAMELNANLFNLRTGKWSDRIYNQFNVVADKIAGSALFVDDTPGQNIMEIRTKARKLKVEKGLDLLIIDYLQLIQGNRKESRVQEVSDISRSLKLIARELEIPVLALAQLSRAVEQRVDKRPQLSDLRESGSIEQDADIVMFLQRDGQFETDADAKGQANLYIAKHRNGPTGNIEMIFVDKAARFREISKVS